LGHTISKDGISVDPSKVQEVMDWKPPKSVHQIRSFLGWRDTTVDSFQTSPESLNPCLNCSRKEWRSYGAKHVRNLSTLWGNT
jgi:hypothetical protein